MTPRPDSMSLTGATATPTVLPTDETDHLIASDKVAGTAVFSARGERLGEIRNFMVDKVSGQVAYVVMTFGGFLGLGERVLPLPWSALRYEAARRGYVVDVDRESLEPAPAPPRC